MACVLFTPSVLIKDIQRNVEDAFSGGKQIIIKTGFVKVFNTQGGRRQSVTKLEKIELSAHPTLPPDSLLILHFYNIFFKD